MTEPVARSGALSPYLTVKGAAAAIDFYRAAFGAVEQFRLTGPDGRIGHAELRIGDATVMLSRRMAGFRRAEPALDRRLARQAPPLCRRLRRGGGPRGRRRRHADAPGHRPVLRRPQRHDRRPVRPQLVRRDAQGAGGAAGNAAPLGRGDGARPAPPERGAPPGNPVRRRGAPGGAGRPGLRRRPPRPAGEPFGPAAPDRAARAAADRFGQRRRPLALPAAVLAPGPLPARAAGRVRLCRPAAPAVRVLGPRGLAAAGGRAAAAALAHGARPRRPGHLRRLARFARERARLRRRRAGARSRARDRWRPGTSPRAAAARAAGGAGATASWRWSSCSGPGWSPRPRAAASSGSTTCRSGCCRAPCSTPRRPSAAEAQRELLRRAARALGVATARDLRDYFRLDAADVPARIAELVEAGELLPVAVEGWPQPAWLDPHGAPAAPDRRAGTAVAVRFAGLGAGADRAAVRLPLPPRDLHARPQAHPRLLCAAVPAGRPAGRPASTCAATARPAACG